MFGATKNDLHLFHKSASKSGRFYFDPCNFSKIN
jgi:hypothetical protein